MLITLLILLLLAASSAFFFKYRYGVSWKRMTMALSFMSRQQPGTAPASLAPKMQLVPRTENSPATDALEAVAQELDDLQWLLQKKKAEFREIESESVVAQALAVRLDMLETNIRSIELRAFQTAAELDHMRAFAYELDELTGEHRRMQEDLAQCQERLQWAAIEKDTLEELLTEKEKAHAALAFQNDQLLQKVQLLQSLNEELGAIADARMIV